MTRRALQLLSDLAWHVVARLVSLPRVAAWLIARAQRTPYTHIRSMDGKSLYMGRWWLFNAYPKDDQGNQKTARYPWLPSVRIHHICRPDLDRDLHDHPWNARTIVLRGWYVEQLPLDAARGMPSASGHCRWCVRSRGDTGRLMYGEYHRIDTISNGGVWTLFLTWRFQGDWGYLVDGRKVPSREYHQVAAARGGRRG